jgi:hypothetical protein
MRLRYEYVRVHIWEAEPQPRICTRTYLSGSRKQQTPGNRGFAFWKTGNQNCHARPGKDWTSQTGRELMFYDSQ